MKLTYLPDGAQRYVDRSDLYAKFILKNQLLNADLWRKEVAVFRSREDILDDGWRGEYFGKMMRGAVLTYRYNPDEDLYLLLECAVRDILSTADGLGRIASYTPAHEFCGWDLWCRKYVMVGCLSFRSICKDEALAAEILDKMRAHLDYIEARIGDGKIPVTDTSVWYGGMNSSSILEPVVEMYRITKEPRYLALAEHIIRCGGCREGDVIRAVEEGVAPHDFPTTKAYETMSFFEGLLAYYEVTWNEKYLARVERFADLVAENEITLIGCAGCRNEHFDHAAVTQSNDVPDKTIMQETCVTVTWMRLQERLLRATGRKKYADRLERSALNALYGAVNLYEEDQFCKEEKAFLPGMPFDSYSPLVFARRGVGIGGFKRFREGGYYGCCACIGSAGTALYPLSSAMRTEQGAVIFFAHAGEIRIPFPSGDLFIQAEGSLLSGMKYRVLSAPTEEVELSIRLPEGAVGGVTVNGEEVSVSEEFFRVKKVWTTGDVAETHYEFALEKHSQGGKVAFTYGPFVLARDEAKEGSIIKKKVPRLEILSYMTVDPEEGEELRIKLHTEKREILLTDYASCGKRWTDKQSHVAVWQKSK